MKQEDKWIFAYKIDKTDDSLAFRKRTIKSKDALFYAEKISDSLDSIYESFEYGDVLEGQYQIWEYPSGKIFKVEPDRKVEEKNYYRTPYSSNGDIWLPKLILVGTEKEKVKVAYDFLSTPVEKKSFFKKIKKLFS